MTFASLLHLKITAWMEVFSTSKVHWGNLLMPDAWILVKCWEAKILIFVPFPTIRA